MNFPGPQNFLGTTFKQHKFDHFQVSVVGYTQTVSEDWHYHDKIHISSIIQGGNMESRKHEDIQVTPDKILVYEQGEIHRNRFTAHPSTNLNIEFEDDFFNQNINFSQLQLDENTNVNFHRIYFELLLSDCQTEESINHMVKGLFWKDSYDSKGEWIPKLKDLLHDCWDEFPSLNDLSHELNVHPITISKYFSKYSGMTLSEYMRKLKVKKAIDLTLNSSHSFVEIALLCGFSDQSHMIRLVKKYVGYTPGDIRSV